MARVYTGYGWRAIKPEASCVDRSVCSHSGGKSGDEIAR